MVKRYLVGVSTDNSLTRPTSWWWLPLASEQDIPVRVIVRSDVTEQPLVGVIRTVIDPDRPDVAVDGDMFLATNARGDIEFVRVRGDAKPARVEKRTPRHTELLGELSLLRREASLLSWAQRQQDPRVLAVVAELGEVSRG